MNIRSVQRLQDGPQGRDYQPDRVQLPFWITRTLVGTLAALGNDGDALSNQPGLLIG